MRAVLAGRLAEYLMAHREFMSHHAAFRRAVHQKYEMLTAEVGQGLDMLGRRSQIRFEQKVRPLLRWLAEQ